MQVGKNDTTPSRDAPLDCCRKHVQRAGTGPGQHDRRSLPLVVLHNDSDRFGIRAPQVKATHNTSPYAVTTRFRDAGKEGDLVALYAIPGNSVVQNH